MNQPSVVSCCPYQSMQIFLGRDYRNFTTGANEQFFAHSGFIYKLCCFFIYLINCPVSEKRRIDISTKNLIRKYLYKLFHRTHMVEINDIRAILCNVFYNRKNIPAYMGYRFPAILLDFSSQLFFIRQGEKIL